MAALYSSGIPDAIDKRWSDSGQTREGIVTMIARIARPSSFGDSPVTERQREQAEALLAACD